MNIYVISPLDPRNAPGRLAALARRNRQANPAQAARAVSSLIRTGRWRGFSKVLGAGLRGNTISRPSTRFADTREVYARQGGEFLGWCGPHGFCPAGE